MEFPRSNAQPAEQAQVQVTVVPDWKSLNSSYMSRTSSTGKRSYFDGKKSSGYDPIEYFHIKQNEPVWALAKNLIGDSITTSSSAIYSSNTDRKLKVRSSFNNYFFPPEIQILIDYLASHHDAFNERFISELVSSVIHPVGFLKSNYTFTTKVPGTVETPYEADYGGIIPVFVRKPGDILKIESRARLVVPTPSEWNNNKFYKDRVHVNGKITMIVEEETVEKNQERFESIFKGFFGNDTLRVDTMLKNINDAGHKSVQPLSDIPNSFLDLVSTIAIDTLQRGLVNREFELVNRFKYSHFVSAFREINDIVNNRKTAFEILLFLMVNELKGQSFRIAIRTIYALHRYLKITPAEMNLEELRQRLILSFNNDNRTAGQDDGPVWAAFVNEFFVNINGPDNQSFEAHMVPVIAEKTLGDLSPSGGLNENEWLRKISEEGHSALNWTDILYYTADDHSPLKSRRLSSKHADSIKMFGDMNPTSDIAANDNSLAFTYPNTNARQLQKEAMNFTIIAHQIFNLTVPTDNTGSSGSALEAEGHLHRHCKDPEVRSLYQESCNRAFRFSMDICKNVLSELLPVEQRERYRIGFDPQTNQNLAMVVDSGHNHVFDHKSLLGITAESMSKTFSDFSHSLCEWLYQQHNKLVISTVEPQVQGGRATAYLK